jgi:hypothetical protein
MGRAAYFSCDEVLVAYQYPRVKKPSSASTSTTMRMIQRMLTDRTPFLFDAEVPG